MGKKKEPKKTKLKPKERQAVLSTGDHAWTDKPLYSAHQVRIVVGKFFEELFALHFGYRRVRSTELDGLPDIQLQQSGLPIFGEIKGSNRKSQFKIHPHQVEYYRKMIDDEEAQNVIWCLAVHEFLDMTRQVTYESDVYKGLAKHILGAVWTTQEIMEELLYNIKVRQYGGEWGDLQIIHARIIKQIFENNGKVDECKEYFRLENLDIEDQMTEELKVFGYTVKPFRLAKITARGKYHDDPF